MEPLQLALLNAKLNLIENEHGNDLTNLPQEAKAELLPFVVDVASCYIQEERNTKFIEKGLEWARVALSIASNHERAKLLEVDAIDKLDNKHVRPQPLGLAIDQLKGVLEKRNDEYGRKAAAILLNLDKRVKDDVLYDTAYAQVVSLRARYCQQIKELVSTSVSVAHAEKGDMKIACDVGKRVVKVKANILHVTPKKLNKLGLEADLSMTVSQALNALLYEGIDTDLVKKLVKFMCLVGAKQPKYSLDLLKQHDAFRRSDVASLSIVSWNAQLMNKTDVKSGK